MKRIRSRAIDGIRVLNQRVTYFVGTALGILTDSALCRFSRTSLRNRTRTSAKRSLALGNRYLLNATVRWRVLILFLAAWLIVEVTFQLLPSSLFTSRPVAEALSQILWYMEQIQLSLVGVALPLMILVTSSIAVRASSTMGSRLLRDLGVSETLLLGIAGASWTGVLLILTNVLQSPVPFWLIRISGALVAGTLVSSAWAIRRIVGSMDSVALYDRIGSWAIAAFRAEVLAGAADILLLKECGRLLRNNADSSQDPALWTIVRARRSGTVVDVNVIALERLRALCRELENAPLPGLHASINDSAIAGETPLVSYMVQGKGLADVRRHYLANRILKIRRKPHLAKRIKSLGDLLLVLKDLGVSAIEDSSEILVGKVADQYDALFKDWMKLESLAPDTFLLEMSSHQLEGHFWHLMSFAAAREDDTYIRRLIETAYRVSSWALGCGAVKMFLRSRNWILDSVRLSQGGTSDIVWDRGLRALVGLLADVMLLPAEGGSIPPREVFDIIIQELLAGVASLAEHALDRRSQGSLKSLLDELSDLEHYGPSGTTTRQTTAAPSKNLWQQHKPRIINELLKTRLAITYELASAALYESYIGRMERKDAEILTRLAHQHFSDGDHLIQGFTSVIAGWTGSRFLFWGKLDTRQDVEARKEMLPYLTVLVLEGLTLTTEEKGFTSKLPPIADKYRDALFGIWEDYIERENISLDTANWDWLYPAAYNCQQSVYDAFPSQLGLVGEEDKGAQ